MNHTYQANRRAFTRKQSKKSFSLHDIYNAAPSMIHENDYIVIDCVLCGARMKSVHNTHDASPLAPSQTAKSANSKGNIGRSCGNCNATRVIPARMRSHMI